MPQKDDKQPRALPDSPKGGGAGRGLSGQVSAVAPTASPTASPLTNGSSPVANGAAPSPEFAAPPTTATPSTEGQVTPPPALPEPAMVEPSGSEYESLLGDETALYRALVARKAPSELKLNKIESEALVNHCITDFQDANSTNTQFIYHMAQMLANWRGMTEPKTFPFEGCANIVVPLTSVLIETMKSRLHKAIFGGEFISKLSYVDKQVPNDQLDEANRWFKWELSKVVHYEDIFDKQLHNTLVYGLDISIPSYTHDTRFLHSWKTYELDEDGQLTQIVAKALEEIVNTPSTWGDEPLLEVTGQTKPGEFKLSDDGKIVFSIDIEKSELRADIWRKETLFDGVKLHQIQLEDLVVNNTDPDLDEIPFFGTRCWYSVAQYRQKLEDGFFIDHGEAINQEIIDSADYGKSPDEIQQPMTEFQDSETGTDSRDLSSSNNSHKYIEVYRWEGWWVWDKSGEDYSVDKLLQPATQVAVWIGVRSKKILKISRLEDLNKDAKRSGVKMGYIEEPNRFYPMGLAEWLRHTQAELDAVHNQRVDAGLLSNVPFGFYKPNSGLGKDAQPIKMEPGKFFPVADPSGVNMPRSNWVPAISFNEEQLIVRYANLQAGLTDPALGQSPAKRQTASEYVGNANAIDTRSEDIIRGITKSVECTLLRILGLYEQYGPRERIFRVGGEGGVQLTKRFSRDRLHGKITLEMLASLRQLNPEMEKQTALDMLQLLLNQILIQSQIVGPDTIYQAVDRLAKLSGYEGVTLHKPDLPPMSDPPDIEEHQMFAGQAPTGPSLMENINEHLHHHEMLMADTETMNKWPSQSRKLLADHVKATLQAQQAKQIDAANRAAMATQMQMEMQRKGIRPGMAGETGPGDGSGPGTAGEGVSGGGASPSSPTPPIQ